MPKKKKTTKCELCGTIIEYATKKPTKCKACRTAEGAPKKYRAHKNKWAAESSMFKILRELFPDVEMIYNGYYSWLPSPKGEPMQIDCYIPELGIGAEYQGAQHYQFVKYFHKTKKRFDYQQECDALKAQLCLGRGVTLLDIRYDKTLTVQYVASVLREKNPSLFYSLLKSKRLRISPEQLQQIEGEQLGK